MLNPIEFDLFVNLILEPSDFMAPYTIIDELPYLMVRIKYFREYLLLRGRLTNLDILEYVWKPFHRKINVFRFSISKYVLHPFFLFQIYCTDNIGFARCPSSENFSNSKVQFR